MDSYFPKTRRLHHAADGLSSRKKITTTTITPAPSTTKPTSTTTSTTPLKRPPEARTPPKPAKIPNTPTTPPDARLQRPLLPPPVKSKSKHNVERIRRPVTIRELFKSSESHPQEKNNNSNASNNNDNHINKDHNDINTGSRLLNLTPLDTAKKATESKLFTDRKKDDQQVIDSGPLKGISSTLLDLIRAKEAAAAARDPEYERETNLLGIAPEIVRIIPTVFAVNKRTVMPYDKVVEKCHKGLRSNYENETIIECLKLMDKVAPEWVSVVEISRGEFMRLNKDAYSIPQLMEAIKKYKKERDR